MKEAHYIGLRAAVITLLMLVGAAMTAGCLGTGPTPAQTGAPRSTVPIVDGGGLAGHASREVRPGRLAEPETPGGTESGRSGDPSAAGSEGASAGGPEFADPRSAPASAAAVTPTSTAAVTGPHPLSIAWLRQRSYSAEPLLIERTLAPGDGYSRQVASYTSDGFKIFALLTVPTGEQPETGWPVIVFNHGYIPPAQYRTTERYVAYVDAFARNGYIVIKPDYRGHGDSEGQARGGYGRPDYTVDVLNATAAVRRLADADKNRVGMWGHSMGGFITLRSMVATDTIKAGVIWAGVVASYPDLMDRWHKRRAGLTHATPWPHTSWRTDLVEQFGSPKENPDLWQSVSANTFLGDLAGPIQLHHGTADASVPIEFSKGLYRQLQAAGVPAELFIYEGDDHNLSRSLAQALSRSVQFFDVNVKGK